MSVDQKDIPGVIAPPPLIYLGFLLVGFLIDWVVPVPVLPDDVQYPVGIVLIVVGLVPFVSAVWMFRKVGTNIPTRKPTMEIVTSGPNRFSRNPIYLGMTAVYAGIAVAADSIWVLALLVPVLVIIHYGVILREERYLEAKFGEEYRRYEASVRRWL
jgi:protein-S-isoprenylcysteine O-methyltransferase Ste14